MIERKDLLDLAFYKKLPFKGSDHEMRYKIEKVQEGEGDAAETFLQVTTWPGPYSFEATDEELMTKHKESFSEEGLQQIVNYLNEHYKDYHSEA